MSRVVRSTLLVTILAFAGQIAAFATQMVAAALFGAGAGMDAFLAASAIPQYLSAVLLGSLNFVFVPIFVDYLATGREDEAWQVASTVVSLILLVLGALVALGMLFPGAILRLTAPGLSSATHLLATQIAMIAWPSILAVGLVSVFTGILQAQSHFGWPATVPVLGAIVSLCVLIALANWLGIVGLAIATTLGMVTQAALLLSVGIRLGRYRSVLNWRHPAVWQVLHLLIPLVLVNVVTKSTTLLDRFLASGLSEGSISHLGYALRILSALSAIISTGIATVIFPRMAVNMTKSDPSAFRSTVSVGLRFMWLAVAPVIAIGTVLALPMIITVFQRGRFSFADSTAVAGLLQLYMLALAPACLGSIAGRSFYAMKDTRTLAVFGTIESIAYVIYTPILAHYLGAVGIVLGYVLLFNGSLLWQVVTIRYKVGNSGGGNVVRSFIRTGLAAMLGGATAWSMTQLTSNAWLQLLLGGIFGLLAYNLGLWILKSPEVRQMRATFRS